MLEQVDEGRYYRIGLFVILSCVLLIAFVFMIMGGGWFQRTVSVESYFDESVQGLSVGSPVKYRGVTVGQVQHIGFIGDRYPQASTVDAPGMLRYVYVGMAFRTMQFLGEIPDRAEETLAQAIAHGLRIHLAQEGLTGHAYLELDFVVEDQAALPLAWRPSGHYIPSRPSTLSTVAHSINRMFSGLEEVDFKVMFENASHAADSLRASLDQVSHVLMVHQGNIDRTIDNVSHLTQDLRLILESISVSPRGFVGTRSLLNMGDG